MTGRPGPGAGRREAAAGGVRPFPRECCEGLGGLEYGQVPAGPRGGRGAPGPLWPPGTGLACGAAARQRRRPRDGHSPPHPTPTPPAPRPWPLPVPPRGSAELLPVTPRDVPAGAAGPGDTRYPVPQVRLPASLARFLPGRDGTCRPHGKSRPGTAWEPPRSLRSSRPGARAARTLPGFGD